jgi:carbon storage regulator
VLVMGRKPGESIRLNGNIEIRILDVTPTKVRLGITAPADVSIEHVEPNLTEEQNLVAAASSFSPAAIASLAGKLQGLALVKARPGSKAGPGGVASAKPVEGSAEQIEPNPTAEQALVAAAGSLSPEAIARLAGKLQRLAVVRQKLPKKF